MPHSQYYTEYTAREDFWAKVIARIVLAILSFGGMLFAEIIVAIYFGSDRLYGTSFNILVRISERADAEGISFFMVFLSWQFLIFPIILGAIVLVFPNALNRWYYDRRECTLEEVKAMSREKKPLGRAATTARGRGKFYDQ